MVRWQTFWHAFSWQRLMPWHDARWQADPAFRRKAQMLVAVGALASAGLCLLLCLFAAHLLLSVIFGRNSTGFAIDGSGNVSNQTYPFSYPSPIVQGSQPPAYSVPNAAAPMPTPTLQATPPGNGINAPTPTIPPCPPATAPTILSGTSVRDGTGPAPMIASCPAVIYLAAPLQTNTPVSIVLIFGRVPQPNCTITITAYRTDGQGNAAIPFIVPDRSCIRGSILTNGTITIGNDSSANANLAAEG